MVTTERIGLEKPAATEPPGRPKHRDADVDGLWSRFDKYAYGAVGLALAVFTWWFTTKVGIVDPQFLTPPQDVWTALVAGFGDGNGGALLLKEQIWPSLRRGIYGFLIALGLGVSIGIVVGSNRTLEKLFEPILLYFRNLSILALFPVFLLFFGIGEQAKIAIVAWAAFWPILINTTSAVKGVERILINAARTLGAGRVYVFTRIVLPASLPNIFPGFRLGASHAFTALVAAEYLGATEGLGIFIRQSQENYRIPDMYAGILVLGIIGVALNLVLSFAEKRITSWQVGLTSK